MSEDPLCLTPQRELSTNARHLPGAHTWHHHSQGKNRQVSAPPPPRGTSPSGNDGEVAPTVRSTTRTRETKEEREGMWMYL
jgi:hypothetical protein